jgi:hypothetical protein
MQRTSLEPDLSSASAKSFVDETSSDPFDHRVIISDSGTTSSTTVFFAIIQNIAAGSASMTLSSSSGS